MSYKFFLSTIAFTILLGACQKKTHPQEVESRLSITETSVDTAVLSALKAPSAYIYRSDHGALYRVYYQNTQTSKKVFIQTGGKLLVLPQKETWAKGAYYEQSNISWELQGSNALLKTAGEQFELKQVSPIVKNFRNEKQQIKTTTTLEDGLSYVLLERKDTPNLKLLQQQKNAKLTQYSNDTVIWIDQNARATLILNGVEDHFELNN